MQKLVIYNHGKDSIPWGEKAIALAEVAKQRGFMFISPDYQSSNDPDLRVKQLLAMDLSAYQDIILAGSSMGAYVATVASEIIRPKGLFLIAPAFFLPGFNVLNLNRLPNVSKCFMVGKTRLCHLKMFGDFANNNALACTCLMQIIACSVFCQLWWMPLTGFYSIGLIDCCYHSTGAVGLLVTADMKSGLGRL